VILAIVLIAAFIPTLDGDCGVEGAREVVEFDVLSPPNTPIELACDQARCHIALQRQGIQVS
jgi:hypothetical protein